MKHAGISIIIPVYNVEKEIDRCLQSVISQSFKDIEIILVDDGSSDRSPVICDEYSLSDGRITVIHKSNSGCSDARNTGISYSKGKYLLFVDSDDYIEADACEVLYAEAERENLDVAAADAYIRNGEKCRISGYNPLLAGITVAGKEFLKKQMKNDKMLVTTWHCMYKRDFIINNNLYFKTGIFHEDELWTPMVFLAAERVKYINKTTYNYVIRPGSITRGEDNVKNGIDIIAVCHELEKIYKNVDDRILRSYLNDYLALLFLHGVSYGGLYEKQYRRLYSRKFLIGKAFRPRTVFKCMLFILSRRLFISVHKYNTAKKEELFTRKYL
jgi:glycosyltransferase involved in cell wall biosynthesis